MKRAIPILFLLAYVGASTELHQLLRLPVFFEHYIEHKALNPEIGLVEFVVIHYLDTKSPDYKMDQQLPFKNAKCPEVSISFALPPDGPAETQIDIVHLSRERIIVKALFIPSSVLFSIWQPPRI
jgi:hypothetical protein